MAGHFITFEGVDGAGKTTQLRRLAAALRRTGCTVTETREPGGSPGGEDIRALLVRGETARWSPETETLLFTAARRDHLERLIDPALAAGSVVLCDRFVDSTRAYQAAGRGAAPELVEALHQLAIGREADRTLVFDLPAEIAAERAAPAGEDRYERFERDFHERLRAAFRAIAENAPERCRLIDASGDPDTVAGAVYAAVADLIPSVD